MLEGECRIVENFQMFREMRPIVSDFFYLDKQKL